MGRNAKRYYSVLAKLLSQGNMLPGWLERQTGEAVLALLTPLTAETLTAYIAFGTEFLTAPETLARIKADDLLAPSLI